MAVRGPITPLTHGGSLIKSELTKTLSRRLNKTNEETLSFTISLDQINLVRRLTIKQGTYTICHMTSVGFQYTGEGDAAVCDKCGLKISNWTADMNPWKIHSERSPNCPFIQSCKSSLPLLSHSSSSSSLSTSNIRNSSTSNEPENPSKRQKLEAIDLTSSGIILFEVTFLRQVRRRTFSHWPHRTIPSTAQMIAAGFFNCNVGDRVICLYCNLICQQWTPHTDDPCEVHKTLSPNCIYVKANLIRPAASSIIIVNESSATGVPNMHSTASTNPDSLRSQEIVHTAACNPAYTEIPKRHASFATWPVENLPSVDDLVRAGFFYTGTKTIVTCFYCNGSLQNWGPKDNPMIEHSRWFPHCAYAKQLCGDDLYRKIQESKRAQQERVRATESGEKTIVGAVGTTAGSTNSRHLLIPDESTLSRLVAARLDLPISQRLLDQNFKLSIIKRCWEDQLRLKQDDFATECDLFIACTILQKQIEHIDGKKENIVIPSIKMNQIREQNEARLHAQASGSAAAVTSTDAEMTTSSQESTTESVTSSESASKPTTPGSQGETKSIKFAGDQESSANTTPSNPCVLCLTEEKRLACIPCGHLATCVPCGHSLRSCPMCRREIEAFVRIYI